MKINRKVVHYGKLGDEAIDYDKHGRKIHVINTVEDYQSITDYHPNGKKKFFNELSFGIFEITENYDINGNIIKSDDKTYNYHDQQKVTYFINRKYDKDGNPIYIDSDNVKLIHRPELDNGNFMSFISESWEPICPVVRI